MSLRPTAGLSGALRSAILAGLVAGAAASAFHAFLTEPVIDRAIAAEAARDAAQPGRAHEEPLVGRAAQKVGLVVGLLLYGLTWGLLVGAGVYLTRGWAPPGWSVGRHGMVVASLAGWSVALFPFLKYPANPPGVGESGTIGYRQTLYVGFILLAVLGVVLAAWLYRHRATGATGARLAPVALYLAWALGIYALMPANPDPVELSETILRPFRALSLTGLVVFWAAFSLALAYVGRQRAGVSARAAR